VCRCLVCFFFVCVCVCVCVCVDGCRRRHRQRGGVKLIIAGNFCLKVVLRMYDKAIDHSILDSQIQRSCCNKNHFCSFVCFLLGFAHPQVSAEAKLVLPIIVPCCLGFAHTQELTWASWKRLQQHPGKQQPQRLWRAATK